MECGGRGPAPGRVRRAAEGRPSPGRPGRRPDELERGRRRHHPHAVPGLGQPPRKSLGIEGHELTVQPFGDAAWCELCGECVEAGDEPRLRVSPTGTRVAVLASDEGVRLLEKSGGRSGDYVAAR